MCMRTGTDGNARQKSAGRSARAVKDRGESIGPQSLLFAVQSLFGVGVAGLCSEFRSLGPHQLAHLIDLILAASRTLGTGKLPSEAKHQGNEHHRAARSYTTDFYIRNAANTTVAERASARGLRPPASSECTWSSA